MENTRNYKIMDIAKWLLSKQAMTPKKLQKMLYYEYAWFLVFSNDDAKNLNTKLFNDKFEAWVHGPVNHEIYSHYKKYGFHEIPKKKSKEIDKKFNSDVLDSLEEVYDTYSKYNGNELERLTHQEQPWKQARGNVGPLDRSNNVIDDNTIYEYYSNLANI